MNITPAMYSMISFCILPFFLFSMKAEEFSSNGFANKFSPSALDPALLDSAGDRATKSLNEIAERIASSEKMYASKFAASTPSTSVVEQSLSDMIASVADQTKAMADVMNSLQNLKPPNLPNLHSPNSVVDKMGNLGAAAGNQLASAAAAAAETAAQGAAALGQQLGRLGENLDMTMALHGEDLLKELDNLGPMVENLGQSIGSVDLNLGQHLLKVSETLGSVKSILNSMSAEDFKTMFDSSDAGVEEMKRLGAMAIVSVGSSVNSAISSASGDMQNLAKHFSESLNNAAGDLGADMSLVKSEMARAASKVSENAKHVITEGGQAMLHGIVKSGAAALGEIGSAASSMTSALSSKMQNLGDLSVDFGGSVKNTAAAIKKGADAISESAQTLGHAATALGKKASTAAEQATALADEAAANSAAAAKAMADEVAKGAQALKAETALLMQDVAGVALWLKHFHMKPIQLPNVSAAVKDASQMVVHGVKGGVAAFLETVPTVVGVAAMGALQLSSAASKFLFPASTYSNVQGDFQRLQQPPIVKFSLEKVELPSPFSSEEENEDDNLSDSFYKSMNLTWSELMSVVEQLSGLAGHSFKLPSKEFAAPEGSPLAGIELGDYLERSLDSVLPPVLKSNPWLSSMALHKGRPFVNNPELSISPFPFQKSNLPLHPKWALNYFPKMDLSAFDIPYMAENLISHPQVAAKKQLRLSS